MRNRLRIAFLLVLASPAAADYPRAGWQAVLCPMAHDVSGTVTIIDEDTVKVEAFTYDGGGMSVYFVLGAQDTDEAYSVGLAIGDDIFGTVYNGESFDIDLPQGTTLDGYNAISVRCVEAGMSFASGPFLETYCYPDFDGDGVLDFFDFLMFLETFDIQGPAADCDENDEFDFFDFLCFGNAFNEGCP
jgi:hypothetical protein